MYSIVFHCIPFFPIRLHFCIYVVISSCYILDLRFELRLRVIVLMHHLEIGQRAEPTWNRNCRAQGRILVHNGSYWLISWKIPWKWMMTGATPILVIQSWFNIVLDLSWSQLLRNVSVDIRFPMFSIFWFGNSWGKASNTAKLLAHFGVRSLLSWCEELLMWSLLICFAKWVKHA